MHTDTFVGPIDAPSSGADGTSATAPAFLPHLCAEDEVEVEVVQEEEDEEEVQPPADCNIETLKPTLDESLYIRDGMLRTHNLNERTVSPSLEKLALHVLQELSEGSRCGFNLQIIVTKVPDATFVSLFLPPPRLRF